MSSESGMLIQSFRRAVDSEVLSVYDASVGYDVADIFHNFKADYTLRGIITGTLTASPGASYAVATLATGDGVTEGTIYTRSVERSHDAKAFREASISATQKTGI